MSAPKQEVVVVAGVGPGLGAALARKFANEGTAVALLARSVDYLNVLGEELRQLGTRAFPCPMVLTDADVVSNAFVRVH